MLVSLHVHTCQTHTAISRYVEHLISSGRTQISSVWGTHVALTLTIVDTNRRTRAAMCRRMIPRSSTSIFTDDLSGTRRGECASVSV